MVAVAQQHRVQVALPPFVEVTGVIVAVLATLPAVESLVHDQHAQLVAGVEERLGGRVVGTADGIETGRLGQADAPVFGVVVGCGAERAVVVVHARSLEFHRLAVEFESLLGVERDRANPEALANDIHHLALDHHLGNRRVEVRRVQRPQRRDRPLELLVEFMRAGGVHVLRRLARGDHPAVGCQNLRPHPHGGAGGPNDWRPACARAPPPSRSDTSGVVMNVPHCGTCTVPGADQPDVPVDSRAGIPPAVSPLVFHLDGDDVVATGAEVFRQVVAETGVAVRMVAEMVGR